MAELAEQGQYFHERCANCAITSGSVQGHFPTVNGSHNTVVTIEGTQAIRDEGSSVVDKYPRNGLGFEIGVRLEGMQRDRMSEKIRTASSSKDKSIERLTLETREEDRIRPQIIPPPWTPTARCHAVREPCRTGFSSVRQV